jgi:CheY-like chemotaxis protein
MPILDGYEATNQIRNYLDSKGLPQPVIIAITGHTEESYVRKAIASGMNAVS